MWQAADHRQVEGCGSWCDGQEKHTVLLPKLLVSSQADPLACLSMCLYAFPDTFWSWATTRTLDPNKVLPNQISRSWCPNHIHGDRIESRKTIACKEHFYPLRQLFSRWKGRSENLIQNNHQTWIAMNHNCSNSFLFMFLRLTTDLNSLSTSGSANLTRAEYPEPLFSSPSHLLCV